MISPFYAVKCFAQTLEISAFRNFINGAKEKLLHGLKKKSDPKMLLSEVSSSLSSLMANLFQSTNSSAYNTALATTPANSDSQSDGNPMTMPFGLSKSAKRKQKMMAKLKASSTTVAIPLQLSHCTVEDLYSWCCDVADSSRPEEERAASLENVADALARTDDFMERLLIRKLASSQFGWLLLLIRIFRLGCAVDSW